MRARVLAALLVLAACTTDSPVVPELTDCPSMDDVVVGEPQWREGSVGERGGFAGGGSIFFDRQQDIDRQLDVAAASGARWIRLDIDWSYVEPEPGRFRWCRTDRVVAGARERGLDVVGLLTYAPDWATGRTELHAAPEDPDDFARFALEAVERYGPIGVTTWEIWNEPNIAGFWVPRPDPEAYASLLAAAGAAIHEADPDAFVIAAGLAPAPDSDDGRFIAPETFMERFYEHADRSSFDAAADHPYTYPGHPRDLDPIEELHRVMARNGDGDKQLWLTEFGAPTGFGDGAVTESVQADFVEEAYEAAGRHPWIGPLFWYTIRDTGTDQLDTFQNFGIVRNKYDEKPSFTTFQQAMAMPD